MVSVVLIKVLLWDFYQRYDLHTSTCMYIYSIYFTLYMMSPTLFPMQCLKTYICIVSYVRFFFQRMSWLLITIKFTDVCDAKGEEDGGEGPQGAPQVGVGDLRHKHAHTELAIKKINWALFFLSFRVLFPRTVFLFIEKWMNFLFLSSHISLKSFNGII